VEVSRLGTESNGFATTGSVRRQVKKNASQPSRRSQIPVARHALVDSSCFERCTSIAQMTAIVDEHTGARLPPKLDNDHPPPAGRVRSPVARHTRVGAPSCQVGRAMLGKAVASQPTRVNASPARLPPPGRARGGRAIGAISPAGIPARLQRRLRSRRRRGSRGE
jgi:hypothetical protein